MSWREAWEGFLTTAKSTAGSSNIPDDALFLLFKSWLDPASKKALQAKRRDNPALTFNEFYRQLNQEMLPLVRGPKNRWQEVTLKKKGESVAFADWRNFKASLEESLAAAKLPPAEDLRDHVIKQLPTSMKEMVLREEAAAARSKFQVVVKLPSSAPRDEILDEIGRKLGLRIPDPNPQNGFVVVDCLTETIFRLALDWDGAVFTDPMGRRSEALTVTLLQNQPLPYTEILRLVDAQVWVDQEMRRIAPEKERSEVPPQRKTYAKVVETGRPAPKVAPQKQSPPPSPTRGVNRDGSPTSTIRPRTPWCRECERARRHAAHDHKTCKFWLEAQKKRDVGSPQSTPPSSPSKSPRSGTPPKKPQVCLTCQKAGRPSNHYSRECADWQKYQADKNKGEGGEAKPESKKTAKTPEVEPKAKAAPVAKDKSSPKQPSKKQGAQ